MLPPPLLSDDCVTSDVDSTGAAAGPVVESGGGGDGVVGGGELGVGASKVEVVAGTIVVGGIDVVWMTVDGPLGEEPDVKETGVEGARVLAKETGSRQFLRGPMASMTLYIPVLLDMFSSLA